MKVWKNQKEVKWKEEKQNMEKRKEENESKMKVLTDGIWNEDERFFREENLRTT